MTTETPVTAEIEKYFGLDPVWSEISDPCEISDLLMFVIFLLLRAKD